MDGGEKVSALRHGERAPAVRRKSRTRAGRVFEECAARFLQQRGYRIVARNWRCRRAEIDIVAWDRGTLVFVEVRGSRTRGWGDPIESVDRGKRRRLAQGAECFLAAHRLDDVPVRFDVVAIRARSGRVSVELLPDAFFL